MIEFIEQGAIFIWSLIALIVGFLLLLALIGLVTHEFFVFVTNKFTNPNNEENLS